ncbi:hypothetical protein Taro_000076 [Colocasia esculenta]|uniref:Uncharacterized protein n=1 Tax=Colocasia esculenta TaxID=4460 RepID=A0A843T600_COLES|nr:hypothetical protein [Colocasia esculenta]
MRACPVREVVTVTWDPHPREPVEGVLYATSVLELAATRQTLELRGKRWSGQWRVSHLQSSRGWSGMPRTVRSSTRCRPASPSSHCLAPCGPRTAWGGLAWDRSPARLWQLLLCYSLCYLALTRCEGQDPAVWRAPGVGDRVVVGVPAASSGSPSFSARHPRGMPLRDLFFPCLLLVLACVRWDYT